MTEKDSNKMVLIDANEACIAIGICPSYPKGYKIWAYEIECESGGIGRRYEYGFNTVVKAR